MKKFLVTNTNPAYGYEGPFEMDGYSDSDIIQGLVDGMESLFRDWADDGWNTIEDMRSEFADGLEVVEVV